MIISPEFKYEPCDVLMSKDGMHLVTIVEFFEIDGKKKVRIKIKPTYLNQREIQETHDLAYLEGCEPYYLKNNNEKKLPPSTTKF